ncbi:putative cytochrome P450 [Biscogniauxia sp. FL1348]|nr:putative cytochrome P450 [Biscogniauxia sp. FL1348]
MLESPSYVLGGVLLLAAVLYRLGYCVYLLWFHPLAKYPGPSLAAISEIWYAKTWTSGQWPRRIQAAHRKYGDIVRIAPNELSFVTAQSFQDIYGPPSKSRKLFPKSELFYATGITNLVFQTDPDEHAKQYKLFAPAFRASALRSQEHVIQEYADLLVSQLRGLAVSTGEAVNMSLWLEWLTFDIIGELTFGESFDAIKETRSHYWVTLLLGSNYGDSLFTMQQRFPILQWAPRVSKTAEEAFRCLAQHRALTLEKTRKRIAMGPSHPRRDFFAHVLRHGTDAEKSVQALSAQATVLLTAHALGTALWFLARPEYARCRRRLQDEVRGHGGDAAQYLQAVLDEALRIMPPVPMGLPRVSPGDTVDGVYVPADIWTLHHDERNVERPDEFGPSRWLTPDGEGEEEGGVRRQRGRPFSVPFSIGPRMCIGVNLAWVEMRVVLAKFVYAFDWTLEEGCPDWVAENKLYMLWKKPKLMIRLRDAPGKGGAVE